MPVPKLKDRVETYQETTNYKILPKLPIIIIVNGRGFSKLTSLLDKPFDLKLAECLYSTTQRLCAEIEGTVFAYSFNDEIILVLRNDQGENTQPWLNNNIQKICSIVSAYASVHFNDCATAAELNLMADPIFTAQVFPVPNITEACNFLIYKQQQNFLTSIQFACFYELLKIYDKETIKNLLIGLTIEEKIDLLMQEVEINFNQYPLEFRRGIAYYKVPKLGEKSLIKNIWSIDKNLPIFTKEQSFLNDLLCVSNF